MRLISSTLVMMVHILWLTLSYTNKARGVSLSKPGCPDTCGNNVTIPYPFGIGPECSANEYFRVECSNTTNPPKPFLEYMSLEALEFSLDRKIVRLMQGVFPIKCSTNTVILVGKTVSRSTPFSYSSLYNRLVVVGCGNEVRVLDYDPGNPSRTSFGGCSPICGPSTPSCNGINCCQTTVPSRFEEAEVFYNSTGNSRAGSVCGYTFLSDQRWLERDYIRYLNRSGNETSLVPLNMSSDAAVPMILEWEFDVSNATTSLQGVKCVNESVYFAASLDNDASNSINTTRCYCDSGFEGNPYLPEGGCRDVDECTNSALNNCVVGQCMNAVGGFMCRDPNNNSKKMQSTVVGISSSSGALIFLGGAWIFSKVIRKRIKANRKKKFFKKNGGFLLEQKLSSNDGGVEKITLFTSKELALATDRYNENRILGRGGQGTVYKGMLPDGKIVAVKKSKRMEQIDIEAFINEVVILSQIRHRNVVRLLGCCLETEVPLLVYEFVPNGTLFELLTGEKAVSAVRGDVGGSLAAHFLHSMDESRVFDILDPKLLKEGRQEEFMAVAKLAQRCLHLKGKSRPTMKEVAAELEGIRVMEDAPILQLQRDNTGFHTIEVPENYDFSTISGYTTFDSITAESSSSPLLIGKS